MAVTGSEKTPGREATIWHRLQEDVAGLHPGYFALVMATGILSTATLELQLASISTPLLLVAAAGYLVLCMLTGWRLLQFPRRVLADATAPERAFAFFTFVAGSDVLGLRLAAAGQSLAAAALALLAAAGRLLLNYAIPLALILAPVKTALSEAVNGTWLIWVVGTQSLAGATATFASMHPAQREALALAAAGLWGLGLSSTCC